MFIAGADFVWHKCLLPIWSKIEMSASNIVRRFCALPSPRYTERRNYAILELTSRRDGIPGVDEKKAGVLLYKAADFIGDGHPAKRVPCRLLLLMGARQKTRNKLEQRERWLRRRNQS